MCVWGGSFSGFCFISMSQTSGSPQKLAGSFLLPSPTLFPLFFPLKAPMALPHFLPPSLPPNCDPIYLYHQAFRVFWVGYAPKTSDRSFAGLIWEPTSFVPAPTSGFPSLTQGSDDGCPLLYFILCGAQPNQALSSALPYFA